MQSGVARYGVAGMASSGALRSGAVRHSRRDAVRLRASERDGVRWGIAGKDRCGKAWLGSH